VSERVLSLDISTKTGFALVVSSEDSIVPESYGQIPKVEMPEGPYPVAFVDWAQTCYSQIKNLVDNLSPDILVIEETASNSKTSHSQKILEFIHFLVAKLIKDTKIRNVYLMTGEWRSIIGAKMTKEESLHNKAIKKYKEKNKTKIAYNEAGKRVGKITKKHVAIRVANETFGQYFKAPLRKKDEDLADALCLALAYHMRKIKVANEQKID